MTRRPGSGRRRGFTLVEAILVATLGLATLGFVLGMFRFFSGRTASSTDEALRARSASLFMERLRRVLRTAIRVESLDGGVLIVYSRDPASGLPPGEAIFAVGEPGTLVITEDGRSSVFDIGDEEGGAISVAAGDGLVQIHLPGTEIFGPPEVLIRPPGTGPELVSVPPLASPGGSRGPSPGVAPVPVPRVAPPPPPPPSWRPPAEVEIDGPGQEEATDFDGAGAEEAGEAVEDGPAVSDGISTEADTAGVEVSPLGGIFLPPTLPPAVDIGSTGSGPLFSGWVNQGYPAGVSGDLAAFTLTWEASVQRRYRQAGAKMLAQIDGVVRATGGTQADTIDGLTAVSPLARALARERPEVVAAARAGAGDELRVPDSLIDADLPGVPDRLDRFSPAAFPQTGGDPLAGTRPDPIDETRGEVVPPDLGVDADVEDLPQVPTAPLPDGTGEVPTSPYPAPGEVPPENGGTIDPMEGWSEPTVLAPPGSEEPTGGGGGGGAGGGAGGGTSTSTSTSTVTENGTTTTTTTVTENGTTTTTTTVTEAGTAPVGTGTTTAQEPVKTTTTQDPTGTATTAGDPGLVGDTSTWETGDPTPAPSPTPTPTSEPMTSAEVEAFCTDACAGMGANVEQSCLDSCYSTYGAVR